ncbi:MAG TPA: serine/threonine-protein kinase [Terriglobales bacterium]|nr:serine/threonine-protein kinase [Terriglobales bacterium]
MQAIQQLGRYEIVAELGRGAMGAVFRARDPRIDRVVAIKTIAVPGADPKIMEEYRQRFYREAQAAGRLSHPGIVTIFDADEDHTNNTPFIVMEYVDGKPLDRFIAADHKGVLDRNTTISLIQQIAAALDYAHAHGIVHRDIKPANILVTGDGQIKIADFGIAKLSQVEATLPGYLLGTPAYMSPEQLSGKPVDGRSDLFSLGVIAYWLFTGQKPFTGESITEVSIQVATKEPRAPSQAAPGLGSGFDQVLARALAKDPTQRFQSGKDFAADLDDVNSGRAARSQAKTVMISSGTERTIAIAAEHSEKVSKRNYKMRRWLWVTAGLLALLMTAAGLVAMISSPAMPATLDIVGTYPFRSGQIYIWVDGELRYHDELRGPSHAPATTGNQFASAGESIDLSIPVRAGRHTVRVQVDAPGNIFDHDTAIPGEFRAFSHKALQLDFRRRRLELNWE